MMRSTIHALTCLIVLATLWAAPAVSGARSTERPLPGTLLWDTQSPFVNKVSFGDRANWTVVHSSRFDKKKYSFRGDAVVENQHVMAVFLSRKGRVSIYSKADSSQKRVE
jgi:hypothetical protein